MVERTSAVVVARFIYIVFNSKVIDVMKWLFIICVCIGIFVVVYFIRPFGVFGQSDMQRKSDITNLQDALNQYYKDNGSYPLSTPKTDAKPYRLQGFKVDHQVIDWGEEWAPYLKNLPKDLDSKKKYVYFTDPNGQAYWLYASLEEDKDKDMCNAGKACISISGNGIAPLSCGGVCNYGVSSRNVSP